MAQAIYRNVRARGLLQVFFLAAVTSLLLVRLYLHLTNYPQLGGDSLHVAHMLWGGVLMLAALVIVLSFLGKNVQRIAAIVGGVGFGVFIDEIGKFITKDNNYFYEPAIGIIYATFVVLYLTFNFLGRKQVLSSREYQLNTLSHLEDAVARDMDPREKALTLALLKRADQKSILTKQLQTLLARIDTIPPKQPNVFSKVVRRIDGAYERFWQRKYSNRLVRTFFIVETIVFLVATLYIIVPNAQNLVGLFDDGRALSSLKMAVGELVSLTVAAGFIIWGVVKLRISRLDALEQFRRAALINISLVNFFMFSRVQFEALPNFFFNLLLLALISYAMHYEQRVRQVSSKP